MTTTSTLTRVQQLSPEQRGLLVQRMQMAQLRPVTPAWSPLTPLQVRDGAPTLYFVHPAGGALFWYLALLKHLGNGYNAYGLQGHGLYGDQTPLTSIPAMAQAYVAAIKTRQPNGPYMLAGYSMGGVIAFEVAQQLQARGDRVAQLFLLDAYLYTARLPYPGRDIADPEERLLVRMLAALPQGQSRQLHQQLRRLPSHRARIDYLFHLGQSVGRIPPTYTVAALDRMYDAMDAHVEALTAYQPRAYGGKATLIQCEDRSESDFVPYLDWAQVVRGGLTRQPAPGKHSTLMEEPHVQRVAHLMRTVLAHGEEER